jgi:surface protein
MFRFNYYGSETSFISEWKTTTPNETITLPYQTNGIYNGIIDWGDGTDSVNSYENRTHTYTTSGTYIIKITGRVRIFRFANTGDRTKLYRVFQWGSRFDVGVGGSHFYGCTNLDLSVVSDVLILYRPFVTSNITSFANMFRDCTSLTTINRVNEWDTSNINNLQACFFLCPNYNSDVSNWNVSNVTIFQSCFGGCTNFNQNIENWNVSSATNMTFMFQNAINFNQPLANWQRTTPNVSTLGNVTNMNNMFNNASAFNQPLNNWNVSNVATYREMFRQATLFNQPLNNWNVLNAKDMFSMFRQATNFNQNIGNWDIRNCLDFTNFMANKTLLNYSTANYDALLIGWASRPVQPNINISFGTIKRTVVSTPSKLILTSPPNNWTIVDGGL